MRHMPRETPRAILVSAVLVLLLSLCPANSQQKASPTTKPTITDVRIVSLPLPTDDEVTFEVAIEGENLGNATNRPPTVNFDTKDPASPARVVSVVPLNSNEIRVKGTAKVGTEITRVVVVVGGESAEPPQGFTLSIKANPPTGELRQFEIKFEHQKNKEFPNLHSLVVTKEAGPADAGFAANPHWMTVDLMPTGGTDLNIVQSNAQQLDLHFVAAPDYEPKSVVITVYNGSDLDKREPKYVSIDKKPLTEDPDQPKIASTEVVFIDRGQGAGRIRIYGKGFGDGFDPPPYPVDDHLRCVERPSMYEEPQELKDREEACGRSMEISFQPEEKVPDAKKAEAQKKWNDWEQKIRQTVTVAVNPRNPEIHVDKVDILEINDKMIDVYFEFTRYANYAEPFRLTDATVTIKKNVQKTTQEIKNDKVTGTVTGAKEQTYSVSYQPGPKRDPNLSYRYTVLDKNSANTLVGRGIADNFFVLQLSVVNNGDKKVTIPLSGIQAEVEWTEFYNEHDNELFLRGPATLPPVPLAAVSGFFDAYQKTQLRRR